MMHPTCRDDDQLSLSSVDCSLFSVGFLVVTEKCSFGYDCSCGIRRRLKYEISLHAVHNELTPLASGNVFDHTKEHLCACALCVRFVSRIIVNGCLPYAIFNCIIDFSTRIGNRLLGKDFNDLFNSTLPWRCQMSVLRSFISATNCWLAKKSPDSTRYL